MTLFTTMCLQFESLHLQFESCWTYGAVQILFTYLLNTDYNLM